jgi:hypothetical protein
LFPIPGAETVQLTAAGGGLSCQEPLLYGFATG